MIVFCCVETYNFPVFYSFFLSVPYCVSILSFWSGWLSFWQTNLTSNFHQETDGSSGRSTAVWCRWHWWGTVCKFQDLVTFFVSWMWACDVHVESVTVWMWGHNHIYTEVRIQFYPSSIVLVLFLFLNMAVVALDIFQTSVTIITV